MVLLSLLSACLLLLAIGESTLVTRHEILKAEEYEYFVEWNVDTVQEFINFTLTARTRGYVGLGLSFTGGMASADIVIAGVHRNGSCYVEDRFARGEMMPELDEQQDWSCFQGTENATHTKVTVGRKLNTCDQKDVPINDDTIKLIWAYGESDDPSHHGHSSRGTLAVNMMDPKKEGVDMSKYSNWTLAQDFEIPEGVDTTYWCTFFQAPNLTEKHHIVGFDVHLRDELTRKYTHHVDVYRCTPPKGVDPDRYFQPHLGGGYDCYHTPLATKWPRDDCQLFEFQWSIGGEVTFFNDDLGVPFDGSQYYMTEIHYNNPKKESGLQVKSGMELYYTNEVRATDVGFLFIGSYGGSTKHALTIPPGSTNFVQTHHCDPSCTTHFPATGISAFVYLLHAHFSGRKIRIRRFRNGTELLPLASDGHFDFNYQSNRILRHEVSILPGDQLSLECEFDNTWKLNNSLDYPDVYSKTTVGGRSPREEMCQTFIMYYPRFAEIGECTSYLPHQRMLEYFSIEEVTNTHGEVDPFVLRPSHLKGRRYSSVVDSVNWTDFRRQEFQNFTRFSPHQGVCFPKVKESEVGLVTVPSKLEEGILPGDSCGGPKVVLKGNVKERSSIVRRFMAFVYRIIDRVKLS